MRYRGVFFTILLVMLGTAGGGYLGFRAGTADTLNTLIGISDDAERRQFSMRYALGMDGFNAIYGQDLWVMHAVFPGVKDGFFLDIGSADGVAISNTKRLEDEGWSGICIDPFPRNMDSRSCNTFAEVVDSEAGRSVRFQSPGKFEGGIVDYAGWWVGDEQKGKTVELTTTTVGEILKRANAPTFIHYMNVDIEGAEYEALKVFPFDRYKIGAITVEHNNLEDRRIMIRDLFESNGYRLEWSIRDQDWYLPKSEPSRAPLVRTSASSRSP